MKFYHLLFSALISVSLLSSCSKETSEENGYLPGVGGTTDSTNDCKACSYFPFCDGSVFMYVDSTVSSSNTSVTSQTYTLHILGDTTISGLVYKKYLDLNNSLSYHNCTNGVTRELFYDSTLSGGIQSQIIQTLLKSNEAVGATWRDVNPGNGVDVISDYSIVAKSISRSVMGVLYSDVIHVHQINSIVDPLLGNVVISQGDSYYARGIGMIENIVVDGTVTPTTYHQLLQSYNIP